MENYIAIDVKDLIFAYGYGLVILIILWVRKIPRSKDLVIACLRMTVQLILLGYILGYIFKQDSFIYSILAVGVMELFAVFNVLKRCGPLANKNLRKVVFIAFISATILSFTFFILFIIRLSPWYSPSYFIPLAGMFIGNSMTGVILSIKHILSDRVKQRAMIENSLMLGGTPKDICKSLIDAGFDNAITPTINSMIGMGIVFIPGMMTGQMLAGVLPTEAIKYQIVIMLGILGSVAISTYLVLYFGYRTLFNKEKQFLN